MRTHAQAMINYANNPEALAFVKIGDVADTSYFIYVEYPLWRDDNSYAVRTDMTVEEAQADRVSTLEQFEEAQAAVAELEALEVAEEAVLDALDEQREVLLARLGH